MPKQTYKILRFDGGISSDADARDIGDNQFAHLQNVAIDQIGKIIILGDIKTTEMSMDGALSNHGFGVKAVSSDYTGFASGTAAETARDYYLLERASDLRIDDLAGAESAEDITISNKTALILYWVDGALRIYDRKNGPLTATACTPKWRGYIEGVLYGSDETGADPKNKGHIWNSYSGSDNQQANRWYTKDAQIKGCFPEVELPTAHGTAGVMVGHNLIAGNNRVAQGDDTGAAGSNANVDTDLASPTALFAFANENCGTGSGPAAPTNFSTPSGMRWGHGLSVNEGANNKGTWCPTGSDSYQFWCTTIYDGKQESIPQLFTMYNPGALHSANNNYHNDTPVTAMSFRNGADRTAVANNIPLWVEPIIKWCDALHTDTTNWTTDPEGNEQITGIDYNFGGSTVSANGINTGNPRITGIKVYWSGSEDGFTDKWLLYEWDFAKGVKSYGAEGASGGSFKEHDYTSGHNAASLSSAHYWYHHTHASNVVSSWGFCTWNTDSNSFTNSGIGSSNGMIFVSPPKFIRYDATNGHSSEDTIVVDAFKAVCIANRRAWIGNVTINGKNYGDRMLKSPVNQFDKFPADANQIDVTINDGDEIVALMEFADRILQFKKDAMYIINISGASEFLESEHKYKGISNLGAVCKTDYGIAWANNDGAYLYNGQQVQDLNEDGGIRKIKKDTFNSFIGTGNFHRVGYNPKKRQIIITNGASDSGAAYIYDLTTKSWTYSGDLITDNNTYSPFFNKPKDGDLLILDDDNNTIDKWSDTPTANPDITITTKDVDFGDPALRKKVYKVYITYKSSSSTVPSVYYDTDGNSTLTTAATGTTAFTYTGGQWTVAEYRFGSDTNSCKSIQLKISGTTHTSFEINDITFVYRTKSIK